MSKLYQDSDLRLAAQHRVALHPDTARARASKGPPHATLETPSGECAVGVVTVDSVRPSRHGGGDGRSAKSWTYAARTARQGGAA